MTYFNPTYTNPTDLVSPATLDSNWDLVDSKFSALNAGSGVAGSTIVGQEAGMEAVASERTTPDIAVSTGAAFNSISTAETWGSWTNMTLAANFNAVSGRTPQLKVSNLGRVLCRGAVQYLTGTTAWPSGYQLINSGQFTNALPVTIDSQQVTATPTLTTSWAYGQAYISWSGSTLSLYLIYVGASLASGNLISLDGLSWFNRT